ncbi:Uncharacterized protein APZ42_011976 [Daphnia magna]|uniref:Uncharacterized protein n=1 Tax=Daphnia magna TaxID=35525 RepID=A0A162SBM7_9CRUS|nr:Uncharacterized protein APZ42_011976 [Daphnia magna]
MIFTACTTVLQIGIVFTKPNSRLRSLVYCERGHVSQRNGSLRLRHQTFPVCYSDAELLKSS